MKVNTEKEKQEIQELIRNRILESMKDIENNTGKDYNDFFDELEKNYARS